MEYEQLYYVDAAGKFIGSYAGPADTIPSNLQGLQAVAITPPDGSAVWDENVWTIPVQFKPIEPAPFWFAAYAMLQLKKDEVLSSIADPDDRYLAELDINTRKTYLRHDDMVVQLSAMNGFTEEQMDALWLHVQENYQ